MTKILILFFFLNQSYSFECSEQLLRLLVYRPPIQVQQLPKTLKVDGPNCHNSVLIWHGIMSELREVKSTEMIEQLSQHFIKLSPISPKKWGDVVVFRLGPKDPILHTAIFLDPHTLWQKPGYLKTELWETIDLWRVAQEYKPYTITEYYRPMKNTRH